MLDKQGFALVLLVLFVLLLAFARRPLKELEARQKEEAEHRQLLKELVLKVNNLELATSRPTTKPTTK